MQHFFTLGQLNIETPTHNPKGMSNRPLGSMYVCFVIQLSNCMVFFDPHPLFGTGSDMMQAGAFVLLGRTNTFGRERPLTLSLSHKRPMLMLPFTSLSTNFVVSWSLYSSQCTCPSLRTTRNPAAFSAIGPFSATGPFSETGPFSAMGPCLSGILGTWIWS